MTLTIARESIVARKRLEVAELETKVKELEASEADKASIGGMRTLIWMLNMEIRDILASA